MNIRRAAAGALTYLATDGMWRALRHRDYALFAVFGWVSTVGLWIQRIGIQWLTWEMTHSFAWLGAVAMVEAVTSTLIMPIGGSLTDRLDRLMLARLGQFGSMVIAALLAAFTLAGMMTMPLLLALLAVNGIVDGFWTPTRLAIVPNLVPREDLAAAIGFGSVTFNISQFIGPAIAGFLIAGFGVGVTFAFYAVSLVCVLAAFYMIRLRPPDAPPRHHAKIIGGFVAAIVSTMRHPALGPFILLSTCVSLFLRPYRELLAGYADGIFHLGIHGLSTIASASGLAATVAGLAITNFARTKGLTNIVLVAMLVNVILLIVFALTNAFPVAVAAAALISATLTVTGISSQILVQHATPDHLRGRVMTLWGLQIRGVIPLGAWIMGIMAGVAGFHVTLLGAAILFLGCWAALIRYRDRMARLEVGQLDVEPALGVVSRPAS